MKQSDYNRAYYARRRSVLRDRARLRKRALTESWRADLRRWDSVNNLSEIPSDLIAAAGLSEWTVRAACGSTLETEY